MGGGGGGGGGGGELRSLDPLRGQCFRSAGDMGGLQTTCLTNNETLVTALHWSTTLTAIN
jgi:hypothetical protein